MPDAIRLPDVETGVLPVHHDDPRYCYWKHGDEWWLHIPDRVTGSLANHDITEHDDGTITVSPSIRMGVGGAEESCHGYLERGVWRDC